MSVQAIQAAISQNVVTTFDLHMPDVMDQLKARYGDQGMGMLPFIRAIGFEMNVPQSSYSHYEDNWIHETITNNTLTVAGAAGADVNITLAPASLDANNRFYPRLYDRVMMTNGTTTYIAAIDVTTPSAPVLTLRPSKSTGVIPAIAAGAELFIYSNAFSEGSGQPLPVVRGAFKYTNYTQMIKESIRGTGKEMTNQDWVMMTEGTGNDVKFLGWFDLARQVDIDVRMQKKIEGALIFEDLTTNTAAVDPVTGESIVTTEGLIPYTKRVGNVYPYTPGTQQTSDYDNFDRILSRQFAPPAYVSYLAQNNHIEAENMLTEYLRNTNVSMVTKAMIETYFQSNEALSVHVGFSAFQKAGRNYMMKRWGNMQDPKVGGAVGYNYKESGMFFPLGKRKDVKSGDQIPTVGVRWKALGPYSRKMEMWDVGGAGPGLKVTEFDNRNVYQRTEFGAHFIAGNNFIYMEKQ